jgi:succinate dehydrogenase / fumarate reductase flavoprotein subunit
MDPKWRQVNLVCSLAPTGEVELVRKPVPAIRPELLGLFDLAELKKYMTDEELASYQPAKDGE